MERVGARALDLKNWNKIKVQIIDIRFSGVTNMYDAATVQRLAHDKHHYELVLFIEDHKDAYGEFITSGKEPHEAASEA